MAEGAEHKPPAAAPEPTLEAPETGAAERRPDRRMLTLLVCPSTRTELVYDDAHHELISRAARLAYPIRDGVPVMTPDEARPLADEEVRRLEKGCGPRGAP